MFYRSIKLRIGKLLFASRISTETTPLKLAIKKLTVLKKLSLVITPWTDLLPWPYTKLVLVNVVICFHRKLKHTIHELCTRCGQQAVVLCVSPGKKNPTYRVFGSSPLDTVVS